MRSTQSAFTILLAVSVTAMVASVLPPFSDFIVLAANNMWPYPGPDIQFDYFIGALMGLLCGALILIGPFEPPVRPTVLICWAVKVAASLFLVPVYEYAYGMDIDGYFFFSDRPINPIGEPYSSGTWNVRLLAWMLFQVIGPSFHGGKVVFSFIGFIGIYLAYRGAVALVKQESPSLFVLMSLVPTSLFWASTLGKDPLNLLGVGLYCYGSLNWLRGLEPRYLFPILTGAALASHIRSYFLPIMAVPLATAFMVQTRRPVIRLLSLPLVFIGLLYAIKTFQTALNVDSFESFSRYQSGVASAWAGGSSFTLPVIDTPAKAILVAPLAIYTALFRPMIFEAHNPFALAAALDNTVLLIIFFYACARSRIRELLQPELILMCTFVVSWAVMYGIGTGNLGAISRFKVQVLPVFIILLVYMARKRTATAPA